MNAVIETIRDLSRPAEAAAELLELNMELAFHETIPVEIQAEVRALTDAVDRQKGGWPSVDPHYVEILLRATLSAQLALMEPSSPESRDRLRMALDGLAAAFAAIAEHEPVSDERTGKELIAWLVERTEVSQAELARLLGVSPRQFQRWLSPSETAGPEGDDLRRVRTVARIVNQLRFSLTPAGVVDWFTWRISDLRGKRPIDLLDKPSRLPELIAIAADLRATSFS
jgi:DNA-binding transcriptional regulator YiaG